MMSAEYINSLADEAAIEAKRNRKRPVVIQDADILTPEQIAKRIPNLGSYRPQGWSIQEHRMADSSGFGSESEPAMTLRQLKAWVLENPDDGYGIIEVGQFQVVIGRFTRNHNHNYKGQKE